MDTCFILKTILSILRSRGMKVNQEVGKTLASFKMWLYRRMPGIVLIYRMKNTYMSD